MARCADKDVPIIRDNYNEWCTKLWIDKVEKNRNWFEDTNHKLYEAFKGITNAPLPKIPAKPAVLVGKDVPELKKELTGLSMKLVAYGEELIKYARAVNKEEAECRKQNEKLFNKVERSFEQQVEVVPDPPTANNNPVPLCVQSSKWSRSYFDWTSLFAGWEKVMHGCVKQGAVVQGEQASPALTKAKLAIAQVSPVPWPPWQDYEDEIA